MMIMMIMIKMMMMMIRRWQTSGSIYFVFTQYRIVSPYHCNTGIEVDCDDR